MSKVVGVVTSKQFGFLYISGLPYDITRVKRFLNKGQGVHIQDIVIYDWNMTNSFRTLTYLKNAYYAEEDESKMVKEFIRATELKKIDTTFSDGLSDGIKKDLAEEGLVITNEGLFITPPTPDMEGDKPAPDFYDTEIKPEILSVLSNDEKRTISIYLQSSLKAAIDCTDYEGEELEEEALKIARWVDRNSTQILVRAEKYLKAGGK